MSRSVCCFVDLVCIIVFKNFNFQIRDIKQNMEISVVINDRINYTQFVVSRRLYCSL